MEKVNEWQHPFVDVFKRFDAFGASSIFKGQVKIYQDLDIARRAFQITGSVLSNSFVQLPDPDRLKSLQLSGRYLYVQFNEIPGKFYVIHFDFKILGRDPTMRISISNMEGQTTQPGTNHIKLTINSPNKKWTVLCIDVQHTLQSSGLLTAGAVKTFEACHILKSIQICANISVRGIYTADQVYDWESLPRQLCFKAVKQGKIQNVYNLIYQPQSLEPKKRVVAVPPQVKNLQAPPFKKVPQPLKMPSSRSPPKLEPYPILQLRKAISFSPQLNPNIILSGSYLYYSTGSIIISYQIESGNQKFLQGHTEAVGAMDVRNNLIASAQIGQKAVIRIWINQKIISSFQGPYTKISHIKLSSGNLMAVVGTDNHNRQVIVIFSLQDIEIKKKPQFIAKQISDFHIQNIKFAPCDQLRLVSCGRENIRFWRIKNNHLPGNPVILKQHARNTIFTCLDFDHSTDDPKAQLSKQITRFVLVGSKLGLIFQINFKTQQLCQIFKVHQAAVSSIAVSSGFCVTGSQDKVLRVWQTDFVEYILQAQHQGVVTSLFISQNATAVSCGTSNGGLGLLDLVDHSYKTLLRSHTQEILQIKLQQYSGLLITLSKDLTIRVWDKEKGQQTYQFMYVKQDPCLHIDPHPQQGYFAAGFGSGTLRIFDIYNTSIKQEMKCHQQAITCLQFSPNGKNLVAGDAGNNYCIYDVQRGYLPVKVIQKGLKSKTQSVSFSSDSQFFCVIGDSGTHFDLYSCSQFKHLQSVFVPNSSIDKLLFSPLNQLYVICSNCSLKIYQIGQEEPLLLHDIPPLHRTKINQIAFSPNVNFVATIGADSLLKVWDYQWVKEPHQVFVGHVVSGTGLIWIEDKLFTTGIHEGIYQWQFLGHQEPILAQRIKKIKFAEEQLVLTETLMNQTQKLMDGDIIPQDLDQALKSNKKKQSISNRLKKKPDVALGTTVKFTPYKIPPITMQLRKQFKKSKKKQVKAKYNYGPTSNRIKYNLPFKHVFYEQSQWPQKDYLQKIQLLRQNRKNFKLDFLVGYQSDVHDNLIWNYLYGWFAYSCDSLLVVQSLNKERCQKIVPLTEPISCMTISKDMKKIILGSASVPVKKNFANSSLQDSSSSKDKSSIEQQTFASIFVLNHEFQIERKLSFHPKGVQQLTFSQNGKYLLSVGNFKECSVCIWDFNSGKIKASTYTLDKINDIRCMQTTFQGRLLQFATVGRDQIHFFGLTKEQRIEYYDVFVGKDQNGQPTELTCCDYLYKNDQIYLVCGNTSGQILVVQYGQFQVIERKKVSASEIVTIKYCAPSKRLVAVSTDGGIYHWTETSLLKQGVNLNFLKINLTFQINAFCMDPLFTEGLFGTSQGISYVNINQNYNSALVGSLNSPPIFTKLINDQQFVTSHSDGKLKLWNLSTGQQIRCYKWKGVCSEVLFDEQMNKLICFFKNNSQIKFINLKKFTRQQVYISEDTVKPEYISDDYVVSAFEARIAGKKAKWVANKKGDLSILNIVTIGKRKQISMTKQAELKSIESLFYFQEKSVLFQITQDGAVNTLVVDIGDGDGQNSPYSFMVLDKFYVNQKQLSPKLCFDFSKLVPESYFAAQIDSSIVYYRNYIKRSNLMIINFNSVRISCLAINQSKKTCQLYAGTKEGGLQVVNVMDFEQRWHLQSIVNSRVQGICIQKSKNQFIVTHESSIAIFRN